MNDPYEHARAQFQQGVAHAERGAWDEARSCFEDALQAVPGRPSTLVNLASVHLATGHPEQALPLLEQALAADAGHVDALLRLAAALALLQRHEDALPVHDRLCALQPQHAPHRLARAQTLRFLERHADAEADVDHALALDPALAEAWTQKGQLLKDQGRPADAVAAFRRAMAHGGDAALHRWFIAGLSDGSATADVPPPSAPLGYVEALFDEYAPSFEQHVRSLGYDVPQRLLQPLPGWQPSGFERALDLGCGSGLCGPGAKALAAAVDGVDLSAPMLALARATGAYDELRQADLVQHLQTTGRRYDLVLAADVFIYVGALDEVFAGVQRVMRPGGVFCFSVEQADDDVDQRLLPTLRYAHSARHLRALADRFGLRWLDLQAAPLRQEQQGAVPGLCAWLRRP